METLGEVLKRYRSGAGYTIEDFSKLTKIPQKMILELEENNFSHLPGDFYIKGYIKNYSRYLNLDYKKLLDLYQRQTSDLFVQSNQKVDYLAKTEVLITPRRLKIFGVVLLGVVLLGYLGFQVKSIFEPPFLEVTSPAENVVVEQNFIDIQGKTEKESRVFINDKEIFIDANGNFSTTLDLTKGINLIKVSAQKKHSKPSVIFREILVK